jgi:SAM-dependent methyltransferase
VPERSSPNATRSNPLHSLFEPQGGGTEVFSAKVADYVAARPDYPAALYEMLRTTCNLGPRADIADIGAGTGLLTQGFLKRGFNVVAVEPNAEMRAAADHLISRFPGYRSVAGTAEDSHLASSSVDLIAAAQAFHWFEIESARAECLRVLRPHGQVALIWNDRLLTDPLHIALDEIFSEYGGARRGALVAHEERRDVPKFFGATAPTELSWPHEHVMNMDGLVSMALSRSYMPQRNSAAGAQVTERVRGIFERFAQDRKLIVRYTTIAIVGRPG